MTSSLPNTINSLCCASTASVIAKPKEEAFSIYWLSYKLIWLCHTGSKIHPCCTHLYASKKPDIREQKHQGLCWINEHYECNQVHNDYIRLGCCVVVHVILPLVPESWWCCVCVKNKKQKKDTDLEFKRWLFDIGILYIRYFLCF